MFLGNVWECTALANKYIRNEKEDKTIVAKNSKNHYKILYKILPINFQIEMKWLIFPAQQKLPKIDSRKSRLSEHINNQRNEKPSEAEPIGLTILE